MRDDGVTCRGSYLLRTACGDCKRCADELAKLTQRQRCIRNDPPSLYDVMMTDEKSLCSCPTCSFREHMLKPNADPCTDHPNND